MKRTFSTVFVLLMFSLLMSFPLSAQDALDCEEGYRAFTHAMGETCIPIEPQRVVVLDTGELDNALALDAPIVGAPVAEAQQYQEYLADQLDGISDTGLISEPNFEAILALNPDLILGSMQRYEAIYEQLSQIAPTVLTASLRVPWQENFVVHADALGKSDLAEELLADYDAHVTEVQDVLGDALDSTTISIIRFRPGQVRLYLKSSYIGYILQDVGLQRPPSQDEDVFSSEISLEQVADVDADYIFITGYATDDSEQDRFLESPLWQTLGAVQNGRAIDVNDDTWIAGLGIQAANMVLEDLVSYLAPQSPEATQEVSLECEAGFRAFDGVVEGTPVEVEPVCVPESPERVAPLDMTITELLLIAGRPPVIASELVLDAYTRMHPELEGVFAELMETTEDTGYPPNVEVVLNASPDLIIGMRDMFTEGLAPELQEIAPTVLYEPVPGDWRARLVFAGEVLGLTETVDELLAEYDARVVTLVELLGEDAGDIEISLVRTFPDQIGLVLVGTAGAATLEDVGLGRPESQAVDYDYVLSELSGRPELLISEEELMRADGDVIFLFGDPEGVTGSPLWDALPAVQAGNAYEVGYYWWGDSLVSAHAMLDDLFTYVAGVDPAEVAPNPFANGFEDE